MPSRMNVYWLECARSSMLCMLRFAEIRAPVRLWQGEDDNLVPPDRARSLAAQIPGSELTILPDRGHFLLHREIGAVLDALTA